MKKAYCNSCDKDVNYILKEEIQNATIDGITFPYVFTQAYCKKCGEPVWPHSVSKLNDISLYDEYKKRVGLLTSKEIIEIRKKLGLTQEGLAREMGCGLKTITRYENGGVQDKAFDNHIRCLEEIYDLKQFIKTKELKLKTEH